jgi:hypothetical protein
MKVDRLADGDIEMMLTGKELYTIRQCLNEVCNGFRVPDFKSRIGVDESVAIELLDDTRISSREKSRLCPKTAFVSALRVMNVACWQTP